MRIGAVGYRRAGAFFAALSLATVQGLEGQACLGYPQGSTGALTAGFGFPDGGTQYSLSGMAASQAGGVYFQGSFGILAYDIEEIENQKIVQGTVSYEVSALTPDASICPTAGIGYAWVEDLNTLSIPFGVGVGGTVPLGPKGGAALTPFAIPQFLYVRQSLDDVADSADSDVYVALQAGATLSVGAFMVGGTVGKIFEEERDAVFSVYVGAAWR